MVALSTSVAVIEPHTSQVYIGLILSSQVEMENWIFTQYLLWTEFWHDNDGAINQHNYLSHILR